jgi:N-methylhydantoinase B
VDDEPIRAGQLIRIRTTGGGGWGDPFQRDVALVRRDVRWGKVSREGAARDYGVIVTGTNDDPEVDVEATEQRRAELRAARGAPSFFDRGPGYARLDPEGRTGPEVDLVG